MNLFILFFSVFAATIKGSLSQELEYDSNTVIVIDGALKTFVKQNGDFRLDGIPDGVHILSVISQEYMFDAV
jgi:hypothetical protein